MDEEITIPFYNDLLFKYFISDNDDKESMYLLKKKNLFVLIQINSFFKTIQAIF